MSDIKTSKIVKLIEIFDQMSKDLSIGRLSNFEKDVLLNLHKETNNDFKYEKRINFIEENISIKNIDYYYTNPISRSSKVMSECRKISKRFLFTGIEKAS